MPAGVSPEARWFTSSNSSKPSVLKEEILSLFDQWRDRLMRYLLGLGLSALDSQEVIQEVFLALFLHLQRGKPRHNLRAWLFQVAHNMGLKQRTISMRNRQTLIEYDATQDFVDRAPNPEDRLSQNERHVRLLRVWEALPEQGRQCLALRAEGLTYREIAKVLDMSLGAVSLSLGRSLARLARGGKRV